jgi:hypothetical protein
MGTVYLIRQVDQEGKELYKIGITKNPIETRLKCLRTGNPCKLDLQGFYTSENYKKIESFLHRLYQSNRLEGEWFQLTNSQVLAFQTECENFDKTITMLLSMNPFYN